MLIPYLDQKRSLMRTAVEESCRGYTRERVRDWQWAPKVTWLRRGANTTEHHCGSTNFVNFALKVLLIAHTYNSRFDVEGTTPRYSGPSLGPKKMERGGGSGFNFFVVCVRLEGSTGTPHQETPGSRLLGWGVCSAA